MVTCYPQDGKKKSYDICSAFAVGCSGRVAIDGKYRGGPAMFYGIDTANEQVWRDVRASGADWYYADNAFFDQCRGAYFRVGKNQLQHSGFGASDGSRFERLKIELQPWREQGEHILVTPQSDHFMRVVCGYPDWLPRTLDTLARLTKRPIRVRNWNRDKKKLAVELPEALRGAWAVVTYSSGSAISAIISGIPAISTTECIARRMCGTLAETIEHPLMPERRRWANVVADNQWTLEEFRSGETWRVLQTQSNFRAVA